MDEPQKPKTLDDKETQAWVEQKLKAWKDLKEHHYLSAFINQMVAGEMRKLATEVEQAWKEERERDT